MIGCRVLKPCARNLGLILKFWRNYSDGGLSKIRNIGIIAHIDAGKTTTTESMLYHAGKIRRMGKVDAGSTVTDFLPSERARGITVQSAAVSFDWEGHFINLIDTPGHVDFTIEVERALHVLDGVVAVLDSSRGVEAQTRTVWRQADKLHIPKIAFVNKMDKVGADYVASVKSMQKSLDVNTFVVQFPIMDNGFRGIMDVLSLKVTEWASIDDPESVKIRDLKPTDTIFDESVALRRKIVEQLCDFDDKIADMYLSKYSDNVLKFPTDILITSLRNSVRNFNAVPVFCGSAVKDVGVTELLNGVAQFLPSPVESSTKLSRAHQNDFLGYSFKVVHHNRYGAVVFVRVLAGELKANSTIYNASKKVEEKAGALFTVFADEYRPTSVITKGSIAGITGLKLTGTGDTIYDARFKEDKLLDPVQIPHPVFFCTVEADSPTEVKALETALGVITREDPSVHVNKDHSSGQTILSGMGELHMEVVVERLRKEFKLQCYIGPLQVAYRENVLSKLKRNLTYERTIFEKKHSIKMTLSVAPNNRGKNVAISLKNMGVKNEISEAVKVGILQACNSGPIMGFPLMSTTVEVTNFEISKNAPFTVITAAVVNLLNDLLQEANCGVLEPIMSVNVLTTEEKLPLVLKSLAQKHAKVLEIQGDDKEKSVFARAPVAEMLGYASAVRKISSGNADLTLKVAGYEQVPDENIESLKDRLMGSGL